MRAGVVRYVWPAWLVVLAWAGWELGVDGFTPTQQILTLAVGVIFVQLASRSRRVRQSGPSGGWLPTDSPSVTIELCATWFPQLDRHG